LSSSQPDTRESKKVKFDGPGKPFDLIGAPPHQMELSSSQWEKKVQGAKKKSVTRDNIYTHIGERITFFPFFYFKFRIIYSRLENKKRNSVYYHSRVNGIIRYACNGQQSGRPVGRNKKKTNNNRKIRDAGWWWRRFPSGYPLLLRERNQTEKKTSR
jgi:hypothetical protein